MRKHILLDKQLGTDAPFCALKDLGKIGQNVIDFYYNIWNRFGILNMETKEKNEELAIAYTNLAYFILNDYRSNYVEDKIKNVDDIETFLSEILTVVFNSVNNFNTERFIGILNDIEADYSKFYDAYDETECDDDEIYDDFVKSVSELIVNEFKRVEDAFEKAHDTIEYNFYNEDEE